MDGWSHKAGQNSSLKNWRDNENGRHVKESAGNEWYGNSMRNEAGYVGKMIMVMGMQGKRWKGRPKRMWMVNYI